MLTTVLNRMLQFLHEYQFLINLFLNVRKYYVIYYFGKHIKFKKKGGKMKLSDSSLFQIRWRVVVENRYFNVGFFLLCIYETHLRWYIYWVRHLQFSLLLHQILPEFKWNFATSHHLVVLQLGILFKLEWIFELFKTFTWRGYGLW